MNNNLLADKMNTENSPVKEMFAERVSNPLAWFAHARSLVAAARATMERASILIDRKEQSNMLNVAAMLYGFGLENLFKAMWIFRQFGSPHSEEWAPKATFPSELKTHDLIKLAGLVGVKLTPEYELSLTLLTDVTTWSGRYPCSIKGDEGSIVRYPLANEHADQLFKKLSRPFTSIS